MQSRALAPGDIPQFREMLSLLGEAFNDAATYTARQPDDDYIRRLLASETFVAVAAFEDEIVIGGLAAYVLPKFEQARSEMTILRREKITDAAA